MKLLTPFAALMVPLLLLSNAAGLAAVNETKCLMRAAADVFDPYAQAPDCLILNRLR